MTQILPVTTIISELRMILSRPTDERFGALFDALRQGMTLDQVAEITGITPFWLLKIQNIVDVERALAAGPDEAIIKKAKRFGFTNLEIAQYSNKDVLEIESQVGLPVYKMVDTCAAEFPAKTPYFYSTYGDKVCEITHSDRKKVMILGSGPIRIGQGIEFDYCTVHAISALRDDGFEVHVVNNNPETVSTDFDTSDRLFFEPMTLEDVSHILQKDDYHGIMVQFGGQNA